LQKILERTNIQALREFLLYGMENEGEVSQSYSDRLKNAYKKQEDIVAEYDERGEESDLYKAIDNILFDYENVYMELGIRAGFLLAKLLREEPKAGQIRRQALSFAFLSGVLLVLPN